MDHEDLERRIAALEQSHREWAKRYADLMTMYLGFGWELVAIREQVLTFAEGVRRK